MYSVSLTFIADALTLMYARHLSPFHASLHLFPFQFLSAAALFIPYLFTSILDRFSKDLSGVDLINKLLMRPTFCHLFHSYGGFFRSTTVGWPNICTESEWYTCHMLSGDILFFCCWFWLFCIFLKTVLIIVIIVDSIFCCVYTEISVAMEDN